MWNLQVNMFQKVFGIVHLLYDNDTKIERRELAAYACCNYRCFSPEQIVANCFYSISLFSQPNF